MSKLYSKFVFIFFFMLVHLSLKAQQLKDIQQAFDIYQKNSPQEKLFIHTDKEHYLSGEILWFKAYTVNASNHSLTNLSKVAYVELLDQNNKPVLQSKISLKNGAGSGSVYVPLTISNGSYKLRAYTKWMQNFGPELFFEKQISLINALNSPEKQKKTSPDQDLQFFPEGGEMIEGLTTNVGFKVIGADGLGVDIKGVIINQKNDTVARFETLKFGIGRFTFTPLANNTYKAIASSTKKEIIIKALPSPKKQGYALSLADNETEQLSLTVSSNLNSQKVYLFVHNGNQTAAAETLSLNDGKATFRIDKNKLSDGISHLTVFNENGQAVAERLYFKRPQQQLKIEASSDFLQYTTRKKVNLHIALNNEKNKPQNANLSLAVRRLDSLQGMSETDIVSYFWLSSELKGNIESPGYYFLQNNQETNKALDNLLLTQGWRRFVWDEVLKAKTPTFSFLPEFNGHLITGKIVDKTGSPLRNTNIFLGTPSRRLQFYVSESDSLGRFILNTKDFYGSNELVVQTNTNIDSTSTITIQSPFAEQYAKFSYPSLNVLPTMLNELKQHSFSTQIQNTYLTDQTKQFYDPGVDSALFYGGAYKVYKPRNYTAFNTLEEVLREYVTETYVSKRQKNFQIRILGNTGLLDGDPLFLLDGVPYFNINKIMASNPNKIEKIEIVRDKYYYGPSYFEGIISLSSFKGNLADIDIEPNALIVDYEGMQLQREFYTPTYETASQQNSRVPDFRSTLYWLPNLPINQQGIGETSFYTSDFPGTYLVAIQGLSSNGIPGSKYIKFEVKK